MQLADPRSAGRRPAGARSRAWPGIDAAIPWSNWQHAFRAWRRRRLTIAALSALDNRSLKDIGIERSEIGSIVQGLGRDPTRVDRNSPGVVPGTYLTTQTATPEGDIVS